MCVLGRSEPAGGNRERPDAAGSKRSRQSLQPDQSKALPTDGRPGGTQRPGHHLRLAADFTKCHITDPQLMG